jgi:hypothetical protein
MSRKLSAELEARSRKEYIPLRSRAIALYAAGDTVGGLAALKSSLADRDVSELPHILALYLSPLRSNKAFDEMKQRVFGDRSMLMTPYPF